MPSDEIVQRRRRRVLWWCVAGIGAVSTVQGALFFAGSHPRDLDDSTVVNLVILGAWLLAGLTALVVAAVWRQPWPALAVVGLVVAFFTVLAITESVQLAMESR